MELSEEFVLKRIAQQENQIDRLSERLHKTDMEPERYKLLLQSAHAQLRYFHALRNPYSEESKTLKQL